MRMSLDFLVVIIVFVGFFCCFFDAGYIETLVLCDFDKCL